jgi:hypothetical protein
MENEIIKIIPKYNNSDANVSVTTPISTTQEPISFRSVQYPSVPEPESKLVRWSCGTVLNHRNTLKQLGIKLVGIDEADSATLGALVQPLLPLSQTHLIEHRYY